VGLSIGFPDLNVSEDIYFVDHLNKYCKRHGTKIVAIKDMVVLHHHRHTLKGFFKQRVKYGQAMVLLEVVRKNYKLIAYLLILLASLPISVYFLRMLALPLYLGVFIVGYTIFKVKLWACIKRNLGLKILLGCLLLSWVGAFVSLLSMYYGLLKSVKGVKIYRA
jgi:hypothetical protein